MITKAADFVIRSIQKNKIFTLKNEEGFALSLSNFYHNEDDELMEMFCFWTDEQSASKHIKEEWSDYEIQDVSLADFLEDWCIAISDQNYVVGLDLDIDMNGVEADSLELLIDICHELGSKGEELTFKKFKGIKQLLHEAKQAIKYE